VSGVYATGPTKSGLFCRSGGINATQPLSCSAGGYFGLSNQQRQ